MASGLSILGACCALTYSDAQNDKSPHGGGLCGERELAGLRSRVYQLLDLGDDDVC